MIQVYTGDGKGKTTAALGVALRMLGNNKKVCVVQFLKKKPANEFVTLKKFKNFKFRQFGDGSFIKKDEINNLQLTIYKNKIKAGLEFAQKQKCDLLILDEINVALFFGLVELKSVMEIIKKCKKSEMKEVILTGRKAPAKLVKYADLVTEMKLIKHYFDQGVKARRGIEL